MNQIEYAEEQMATLKNYFKILNLAKYAQNKKIKILCSLLITKETGFFVSELSKYGFDVRLVSSNPISTNLEVVKELKELGIKVYWIKKDNNGDFKKLLARSLEFNPDYIIDDGGDLVDLLQKLNIPSIKGCCEETTSGITIDKKIFNENHLKFPVIAVNNARTKNLMDNHFGTGQSTVDGIIRATQEMIAGKNVIICGYGNCGSGIAKRLTGFGARVSITEIDPIKALQAFYDGYKIGILSELGKTADIIITVTGGINAVSEKDFSKLKSGCILANAGHSNCEIDVNFLREKYSLIYESKNYDVFLRGKQRIILLGKGRIINVVAANGHPSEIMALSYSSQAAGLDFLLRNNLAPNIYELPTKYEDKIAKIHLTAKGQKLTALRTEQKDYFSGIL